MSDGSFHVRKRHEMRLSMDMLPSRRSRPPVWVRRIRRSRRGSFRWMDTPWHRKVIPVMGRKSKPIRLASPAPAPPPQENQKP